MQKTPEIYGVLSLQIDGGRDECPLLRPTIRLGRSRDNDIVLQDPNVSRGHARLQLTPDGFEIQDQGSGNGTLVNGQPLPPRRPRLLRPGDVIEIASFRLAIHRPPAGPPPPYLGDQLFVQLPPQPGLVVCTRGKIEKVSLDQAQITLGRSSDNDMVLASEGASRHHARVERLGQEYRIVDLGSSNGLIYNGQRIPEKQLQDGDTFQVGDEVTIQFRTFVGFLPVPQEPGLVITDLPTGQEPVRIGRSADNQVVLDHPQISRHHALIERMGTHRYRIRDLKSTHGVFVNYQKVIDAWLREGDEIQIGPFRLRMRERSIGRLPDHGLQIDAIRLQQKVSKDKNLLQDISLSIHPQELVAVVGLSGSGKTTLMKALCGFWPASGGTVRVNDVDLYRNFDLFRNELGYVPQQNIVHTELSVYQALEYAAQLRMPADTSPAERIRRIMEVLQDLDLVGQKDQAIHTLSGGQLKRVSIGVELLTKPRLFFLDEPTSGLDPGTEYGMMKLMRHLADQGRTVMLSTHATKNVMLCDKVVFIVRGGHVAYFGPPEEALAYFDRYRTAQERREKDMDFDNIYIILEDRQRGSPEQWDRRYRQSAACRDYVVQRLQASRAVTLTREASPTSVLRRFFAAKGRRVSAWRQLMILSARNLRILVGDRLSLILMLLVPIALGLFGFIWKRNLFDPVDGNPGTILTMLFMDGLIAIFTGAISSVLQIVRENDIYSRERIVGLKIGPYILSKLWIGVVLALYQALILFVARILWVDMKLPGAGAYLALYVTYFLAILSGYLLGLLISAAAPNLNIAMLLIIVVLVPQFFFAGALLPLDVVPGAEAISVITSSRWAFEAFANLTTLGDKLVADPCWDDRPKEDRAGETGWRTLLSSSEEQKQAQGCLCMGAAIFARCGGFPGILNADFYDDKARLALSGPEPIEPLAPTPYPIPSSAAEAQGAEYQALRQQQGDEYSSLMQQYGDAKADWQRARDGAIRGAEGMLKTVYENFGRTFKGTVTTRWAIMIANMLWVLALIFFFQKRKDVV